MTTPKSASSACCSTTSQAGISSPRASRSRTSPPFRERAVRPDPSQLQPYSWRILPLPVRLPRRHARLLHRGASLPPSARLSVLLHFSCEQGLHRRRAAPKVQVSRQQCLDDHGGREPRVPARQARGRGYVSFIVTSYPVRHGTATIVDRAAPAAQSSPRPRNVVFREARRVLHTLPHAPMP